MERIWAIFYEGTLIGAYDDGSPLRGALAAARVVPGAEVVEYVRSADASERLSISEAERARLVDAVGRWAIKGERAEAKLGDVEKMAADWAWVHGKLETVEEELRKERVRADGAEAELGRVRAVLGDRQRELEEMQVRALKAEAALAEARKCSANEACQAAFREQGNRLRAAEARAAKAEARVAELIDRAVLAEAEAGRAIHDIGVARARVAELEKARAADLAAVTRLVGK